MKPGENINSLLVMHEEGALDPESARELDQLLAEDEKAGEALVQHYLLTSEIEDFLGHAENRRANLSTIPLGVMARPKRRMNWGLTAGLAVAASFVVVVGTKRIFDSGSDQIQTNPVATRGFATVRDLRGVVEFVATSGRRTVSSGMILKEGESIEVAGGALAGLESDDGTRIDLGPGSRFTPTSEQAGPGDDINTRILRLDRGSLRASVARQRPGHFLAFVTPHARATVLGTELAVSVEEALTRVSVDHGKVLVEALDEGTKIVLGAGQTTTAHQRPAGGNDVRAVNVPGTFQVPQLPVTASWDFEDGLLPSSFLHGQIAAAPAGRTGNRFAAMGTVIGVKGPVFAIGIESRTTLVRYSQKAKIGFDYWLSSGGSQVTVQIRNRDQRQNYKLVFFATSHETWTHTEVLVSDFQPILDATRKMETGDAVDHLYIIGGQLGGGPFYIDNIKVFGDSP